MTAFAPTGVPRPQPDAVPAARRFASGRLSARLAKRAHPRTVPWVTVTGLALVMALADGFCRVSLQGAVGAIERAQGPFADWLRQSLLSVPLFMAAVLTALAAARRWHGEPLVRTGAVMAAGAAIAVACTVTGSALVIANSVRDYQLQARQIEFTHAVHSSAAEQRDHAALEAQGVCAGVCAAKERTRSVHVWAVLYSTAVMGAVNLLLTGWVIALAGGSVEAARRPTVASGSSPGLT